MRRGLWGSALSAILFALAGAAQAMAQKTVQLAATATPFHFKGPAAAVDVLGLKTGMSLEEVRASMKGGFAQAYAEGTTQLSGTANGVTTQSQEWVNEIHGERKSEDGKVNDVVWVYLSSPASGNVSVGIHRVSTFTAEAQPAPKTVVDGMFAKYGQPTAQPGMPRLKANNSSLDLTDSYAWAFGPSGRVESCDQLCATPFTMWNPVDRVSYTPAEQEQQKGHQLVLQAMMSVTNDKSRVFAIDFSLVDYETRVADAHEVRKQLEAAVKSLAAAVPAPGPVPKF